MNLFRQLANKVGFVHKDQMQDAIRTALVGFQAAALSRLTGDWTTGTLSADSAARKDLKVVTNRSRNLRDNNPYAKAFMRMAKVNIVGEEGMNFRNRAK